MQKRSMNSSGHGMMVALVMLATRGPLRGSKGARELSFISMEIGCQHDRLIGKKKTEKLFEEAPKIGSATGKRSDGVSYLAR